VRYTGSIENARAPDQTVEALADRMRETAYAFLDCHLTTAAVT
jgi:hypothetical protein